MYTDLLEIKNFIYSPAEVAIVGNKMLTEMQSFMPEDEIGYCTSIHSLAYKLLPIRSKAASEEMVAVLFITREEELQDLYEFRDLLENINIIIILPEDADSLDNQAKELRPVLTTRGCDLSLALAQIANLRCNLIEQ